GGGGTAAILARRVAGRGVDQRDGGAASAGLRARSAGAVIGHVQRVGGLVDGRDVGTLADLDDREPLGAAIGPDGIALRGVDHRDRVGVVVRHIQGVHGGVERPPDGEFPDRCGCHRWQFEVFPALQVAPLITWTLWPKPLGPPKSAYRVSVTGSTNTNWKPPAWPGTFPTTR